MLLNELVCCLLSNVLVEAPRDLRGFFACRSLQSARALSTNLQYEIGTAATRHKI